MVLYELILTLHWEAHLKQVLTFFFSFPLVLLPLWQELVYFVFWSIPEVNNSRDNPQLAETGSWWINTHIFQKKIGRHSICFCQILPLSSPVACLIPSLQLPGITHQINICTQVRVSGSSFGDTLINPDPRFLQPSSSQLTW